MRRWCGSDRWMEDAHVDFANDAGLHVDGRIALTRAITAPALSSLSHPTAVATTCRHVGDA